MDIHSLKQQVKVTFKLRGDYDEDTEEYGYYTSKTFTFDNPELAPPASDSEQGTETDPVVIYRNKLIQRWTSSEPVIGQYVIDGFPEGEAAFNIPTWNKVLQKSDFEDAEEMGKAQSGDSTNRQEVFGQELECYDVEITFITTSSYEYSKDTLDS